MSIEIREVKTKAEATLFVDLPFRLYQGNKFWVPPLKDGELKALFPESNPAFEFCDAKFWIAFRDGKVVGRIGAIINRAAIEKSGEKKGRFSRFECENDMEVSHALFLVAEKYLRENGMTSVEGPLGFSNLDLQGLLVEGFDQLASIASVYHHAYYQKLVEGEGYEKETDWIEFRLTVGEAAVEKANRGAALVSKRYGVEMMHFKKISELLPYSETIFQILNDAFGDLPFVTPLTQKMMAFYKEKYIKLLNPEFVKLVKMKGEIIGFVIGLPSLSEAMQKAGGKLFPFGFYHILQARKGKDVMDQLLTGVKKEFQSTGAGVMLMAGLQQEMQKRGMKYIETTGMFETNQEAIRNWKNYEHIQHKRKRCFIKSL